MKICEFFKNNVWRRKCSKLYVYIVYYVLWFPCSKKHRLWRHVYIDIICYIFYIYYICYSTLCNNLHWKYIYKYRVSKKIWKYRIPTTVPYKYFALNFLIEDFVNPRIRKTCCFCFVFKRCQVFRTPCIAQYHWYPIPSGNYVQLCNIKLFIYNLYLTSRNIQNS